MPDWSIKIQGKPAVFTPDIDGTKPGTPLKVVTGRYRQLEQHDQRRSTSPCRTIPTYGAFMAGPIKSRSSSTAYNVAAPAGTTISYHCSFIRRSAARSSSSISETTDGGRSMPSVTQCSIETRTETREVIMAMHSQPPGLLALLSFRLSRRCSRPRRRPVPVSRRASRCLKIPELVSATTGCCAERSF